MNRYEKGTRVSWRWGAHTANGHVTTIFEQDVTRTIEGTQVTRHASPAEPAYMIEQDDGARVLKRHSELSRVA
ncbi:DUF2945 domain-containing protein [Aquibium carbonis]|uniref:DUF2945 domain-containing protein n=1 Tax=Aquibium carbonis TaxID=2495581 RepID=A0A3R9YTH3_9HYPH|nr:DUF2945 domain-containing protein [Aquibium carbonis]RST86705.1 DUF2945 domain-containing protein [Aquibium carbonis]